MVTFGWLIRDLVPVFGQELFYFYKEIRMSTNDFSKYDTRMVEMVFPNQTNHYGTLFGGHALELMDKSAFITASRYARKSMVTASSERIDFKTPVKHGYLVEVIGRIVKRGNSSVTVNVELFGENLLSGERPLCAHGNFVLVSFDTTSKPLALDCSLQSLPI